MSEAEEYLSVLVSLELAYALAVIDNRPPNKAIKHCCKRLADRIESPAIRKIVLHLATNFYPAGRLKQLRRELDSYITTGKFD